VTRDADFASDGASARIRLLALVAAVCAFGLVVLAVAVGHGPLPIDVTIRDALNVGAPVPPVLSVLNIVGAALVWDAGLAVVVAAMFFAGRRIEAAWLAGGVLAGETLATIIKLIVDRPRPPGIAVIDLVTQASFPSGHVTRTAVTLAIAVLLMPDVRPGRMLVTAAAVVVMFLMGLARIVSGEHWPTDVVGGYLVSGVVVACAAAGRARFRASAQVRPPRGRLDPGGAAPPP
jgi:undecaprenyl-diphosphatase